jgi:hypothetical protein
MPKVKIGLYRPLIQTCGVGEIGIFRHSGDPSYIHQHHTFNALKVDKAVAGCGWLICSFTPNMAVYQEAYDQLVERFGTPVFQSEVRVNERTKHNFFFCIFDAKGS